MDLLEARFWYEKASKANHFYALFNLAVLYQKGSHGIEKNEEESFRLFALAGMKGYPRAMHNCAFMLQEGMGTRQDMGAAIRWYERAASKGHVDSLVNLAMLLETGTLG